MNEQQLEQFILNYRNGILVKGEANGEISAEVEQALYDVDKDVATHFNIKLTFKLRNQIRNTALRLILDWAKENGYLD